MTHMALHVSLISESNGIISHPMYNDAPTPVTMLDSLPVRTHLRTGLLVQLYLSRNREHWSR